MADVLVNDETNEAVFLNEATNAWVPSKLLTNEAGKRIAWDGYAWVPVRDKPKPVDDKPQSLLGELGYAVMRGKQYVDIGTTILGGEIGLPGHSKEEVAQSITKEAGELEKYKPSDRLQKIKEEADKDKDIGDVWNRYLERPAYDSLRYVLSSVAESVAPSALIGLGALAGLPGGPAGVAAGVGASSAAQEYASTIFSQMQEKGVDARNPQAVLAFLNNKEAMSDAREAGALRGVATGAFDALTARLAGRFIAALPKGSGRIAYAGAAAKETGLQAAGGAGGSIAADILEKGTVDANAAVTEAFAEIPLGIIETILGVRARGGRKTRIAPENITPDDLQGAIVTLKNDQEQKVEAFSKLADDMARVTGVTPEQYDAMEKLGVFNIPDISASAKKIEAPFEAAKAQYPEYADAFERMKLAALAANEASSNLSIAEKGAAKYKGGRKGKQDAASDAVSILAYQAEAAAERKAELEAQRLADEKVNAESLVQKQTLGGREDLAASIEDQIRQPPGLIPTEQRATEGPQVPPSSRWGTQLSGNQQQRQAADLEAINNAMTTPGGMVNRGYPGPTPGATNQAAAAKANAEAASIAGAQQEQVLAERAAAVAGAGQTRDLAVAGAEQASSLAETEGARQGVLEATQETADLAKASQAPTPDERTDAQITVDKGKAAVTPTPSDAATRNRTKLIKSVTQRYFASLPTGAEAFGPALQQELKDAGIIISLKEANELIQEYSPTPIGRKGKSRQSSELGLDIEEVAANIGGNASPKSGLSVSPTYSTPVAEATAIVNRYLEKLAARNKQGAESASALRGVIFGESFDKDQALTALKIINGVEKVMGKAALTNPVGIRFFQKMGDAAARTTTEDTALNSVLEFSLAPEAIAVAGQNYAHETMHVLQDLFKRVDPQAHSVLNKAFPEGMNASNIPSNLVRFLKRHSNPSTGNTYWSDMEGVLNRGNKPASEYMAYVFGAINDIQESGVKMDPSVGGAFVKFANFIKDVLRSIRNSVYTPVGVKSLEIMKKLASGERQKKFADAPLTRMSEGEQQPSALVTPEKQPRESSNLVSPPSNLTPEQTAAQLQALGYRQDNPAVSRGDTDWLRFAQLRARGGLKLATGSVTGHLRDVSIPVDLLKNIPGAMDENPRPGTVKYDRLMGAIKDYGWKPTPILVRVNHKGKPYIFEGNNRVAVAKALGKTHIPGEINWMNGAEEVDGPWNPKRIAHRLLPIQRQSSNLVAPPSNLTPEQTTTFNEINGIIARTEAATAPVGDRAAREVAKDISKGWFEPVKKFFDPLRGIGDAGSYRLYKGLTHGTIDTMKNGLKKLVAPISKATKDHPAIYTYMTTPGASPSAITDPEARAAAVKAKRIINGIQENLVRRKIISKDEADKYADAYLPRMFLAYLKDKRNATGMRVGFMDYTKSRVPLSEKQLMQLGEVKDPAYLISEAIFRPVRDMAILNFYERMGQQTGVKWVVGLEKHKFEGTELSLPAMLDRAESLLEGVENGIVGPDRAQETKDYANRMRNFASDKLQQLTDTFDAKLYKKIPNDKRYGSLRSMWIRKEIYEDVLGQSGFMPSDAEGMMKFIEDGSFLGNVQRRWKQAKVPLNPPTVMTNIMSNIMLASLSGHNLALLPYDIYDAMMQNIKGGKLKEIAQRHGFHASNMSEAEMKTTLNELQRRYNASGGGIGQTMSMVRAIGRGMDSIANFYGTIETVFKMAIVKDGLRKGLSEKEAVLRAQKWLFDYSEVNRTVKWLRNIPFGSPFITWTYKVIPLMVETALSKNIVRFAPFVGAYYLLSLWATEGLKEMGGDDEDKRKLLKRLPERVAENKLLAMTGAGNFVNIGKLMPFEPFFKVATALEKGSSYEVAKSIALMGGPIADILIAFATGKDQFTGRDIVPKSASKIESPLYAASFLANEMLPAFLKDMPKMAVGSMAGRPDDVARSEGLAAEIIKKLSGIEGPKRSGFEEKQWTEIGAAMLGINVYNPTQMQYAINVDKELRKITNIKADMNEALKDPRLSPDERRKVAERYAEKIREAAKEIRKFTEDAALSPGVAKNLASRQPVR